MAASSSSTQSRLVVAGLQAAGLLAYFLARSLWLPC